MLLSELNEAVNNHQDDIIEHTKIEEIVENKIHTMGGLELFSLTHKIIALVVTLVVIFILYVCILKPNLTGRWVADDGKTYMFKQSKFFSNGKYTIKDNMSSEESKGTVSGSQVVFNNLTGVWNKKNIITFSDNSMLRREIL